MLKWHPFGTTSVFQGQPQRQSTGSRETFHSSTDGLMQLEERKGEDKPHMRADRGLVSIAALQLGDRIGQLQRCDLP